MVMRLSGPARRRQLLDAAVPIFARLGYHDASMNDIAEAAGITKPVLYQHFHSKRELFLAVVTDVAVGMRQAVQQATSTAAGPRHQVEHGFAAWFDWVDHHRDGFHVLFNHDVGRDPEIATEAAIAQRHFAEGLSELIVVEGLSDERQRLLAYGIVGLAEATCRHWLAKEIDLDAQELAVQLSGLVWSGLRGLQAPVDPAPRPV